MASHKTRILVAESDRFLPRAADILHRLGELTLANLDRAGLLNSVREVDVLWVRLRHRIDGEVMAAAPVLRIIATPTTGLNHIDLTEAERRGVHVLSLRGQVDFLQEIRATAEHTVGLMLALLRYVPDAFAHVLAGGWNRDLFWGNELHGKTVGVVGCGRLGRIVAGYLKAFDTRVLTSDPNVAPQHVPPGAALVSLDALLREADIVTLHVNLREETQGFFGREQFAAMKPGAWFINTARGELVDERALLKSLRTGRIAGAALDVLSDEHSIGMRDYPLVAYAREHDNLIITPHIGGCTDESMEKTEIFLAERLLAMLRNEG